MDSLPKLQRINQLPQSLVAVEQSLAILFENGPAFSVLIASHLACEPDHGSVKFEDCTQVRIEFDGNYLLRNFKTVVVQYDSESGFWMASPDQFDSLFSQPSADPYAVLQLSRSRSIALERSITREDFDEIFEILRCSFASQPQFYSPSPTELHAPENYATGRRGFKLSKRFL
jgi:hypothetical protein